MGKWNIPLILKRMIEVLLVLAPILMVVLPFVFRLDSPVVGKVFPSWVTLVFIESSAVFCWLILLMLRRLLTTVTETSPFVFENVQCLKRISYFCAAIALLMLIKTFLDFSVMTPIIAILALLSSLFCQTLAMVFDKAVRIKDENDLTI